MRLAVLAILIVLPEAAAAEITGKPRVIDGNTIEIAGQRIRLHGIDAPESAQDCLADTRRWPCGRNATLALAGMIGTNWVTCREHVRDRYGRIAAVCHLAGARGADVGAMMVAAGWALADRRIASDYVSQEARARRPAFFACSL